jgi:hypothetical protein
MSLYHWSKDGNSTYINRTYVDQPPEPSISFLKINFRLRILARDSMVYFLFMFCTSSDMPGSLSSTLQSLAVLVSNLFIARFGRDFLGSLLIAYVTTPLPRPPIHSFP